MQFCSAAMALSSSVLSAGGNCTEMGQFWVFFPILVGEWPLQSFSSSVLLPPEGFSLAGPGFQLSARSLGGLSCSFLWLPPVLGGRLG